MPAALYLHLTYVQLTLASMTTHHNHALNIYCKLIENVLHLLLKNIPYTFPYTLYMISMYIRIYVYTIVYVCVTANVGNHFVQQSAGNTVLPQSQQQSQQQQVQSQPQSSQSQHTHTGTALQQQHSTTPVQQMVPTPAAVLDRQVPIQITLPPQTGVPDAPQRILTIQVPASAIQGEK